MTVFKGIDSTSDLDYPTVDPTLNLNFALTKTLDPRITFTRNSTATYVGSDGLIKTAVANEPRFEHDPVTGKCLGLLVEESRTNYVYPSTTGSSGGSWGNQGAPLISNAGMSPDGTNTAILTAWNTVSESERIYYDTGTPLYVGVTEIHSFFIKSAQYGSRFTATFQGVNWSWINGLTNTKSFTFDFDAETLSVNTGLISSYGTTVIKYNNGWYRICIPAINNGNGGFANTYVYFGRASQVGNWYIWGCQREVGTFPTSYIPTSGSTVTRAADNASITGTNFTDWYNTSDGALVSIGEENSHKISSNTLTINSNSSSKNVVPNILYYPKTIQYPTLKTMNAYPSQVTDGLVLQLDAGLKKSYVGVGTFWNDLSGNGNTGTLVNGVGYNSDNGGSLVFDGVDDYVSLPNTGIRNLLSTNCTISVVCSYSTKAGLIYPTLMGSMSFGANYIGWRLVFTASNRTLTFSNASGTNGSNQSTLGFNYIFPDNINQFTHISCTWVAGTGAKKTYINGVLTNSTSSSLYGFGENVSEGTRIGSLPIGQPDNFFSGRVANAMLYNRALSAAEVQQNFNALRGRYGI